MPNCQSDDTALQDPRPFSFDTHHEFHFGVGDAIVKLPAKVDKLMSSVCASIETCLGMWGWLVHG